jgi:hypothetical protein
MTRLPGSSITRRAASVSGYADRVSEALPHWFAFALAVGFTFAVVFDLVGSPQPAVVGTIHVAHIPGEE